MTAQVRSLRSRGRDPDDRAEAMRALARRVVDEGDREAAIVLGDALLEDGLERIDTGRVRPVQFRTRSSWQPPDRRILTGDELRHIENIARGLRATFDVPGFEMLYNVDNFARRPDNERWGRIWAQWITPWWPETYRAMVEQRVLPASIADAELSRDDVMNTRNEDELLAHRIHLVRTPARRRRPIRTPLLDIVRLESDNPATRSVHFDRLEP